MDTQLVFERHLRLDGCANLRDIGGYATADGRYTQEGSIFRSDSLHQLPPASQWALLQRGVRTIIDLRGSGEIEQGAHAFAHVAGVHYLHLPLIGDEFGMRMANLPAALHLFNCLILDACQPRIRLILETIAASPAPLVVHCAAGKDRTGLIVALLLGIANVPPATIAADYALSNRYLAPVLDTLQRHAVQAGYGMLRDGWLLEARPETMLNTLAYLDRRYGGVGGYVRRIGLEEEQLRRLHTRLVE